MHSSRRRYTATQLVYACAKVDNRSQRAFNTIKAIFATMEDQQMYGQREKAQRDCERSILGTREVAWEDGIAVGEKLGLEKVTLAGKNRLLPELHLAKSDAIGKDVSDSVTSRDRMKVD
jgi:hypothetical protein